MTATARIEPAPPADADGRRLRRAHNREAVIDALLALFQEGSLDPATAEIAARAGLSPRSLFRYFDDVDDLHRAAADRQIRLARPLLQLAAVPGDPTAAKIECVVRSRVALYHLIGPAARALRACAHRHPLLAAELRRNRAHLRVQLRELFAAELAGPRGGLLPAVEVLCSAEAHELLSRDQGLPEPVVTATLIAALTALLMGPPDA